MDTRRRLALAALVLSFVALAAAPLVLPSDFSPIAHTTSESAGQGIPGAWLPRTGFVLFGVGVLAALPRRGGRIGAGCHGLFGVAMLVVAGWSSRSWRDGPYDGTEDLVHSVGATAMGFAFAAGVTAAAIRSAVQQERPRLLDVTAVVASVALPLAMVASANLTGLLQRTMFAIAYAWYARELLREDVPQS